MTNKNTVHLYTTCFGLYGGHNQIECKVYIKQTVDQSDTSPLHIPCVTVTIKLLYHKQEQYYNNIKNK